LYRQRAAERNTRRYCRLPAVDATTLAALVAWGFKTMAEPSRPARIWYQSFVHPVEQAPYIERLQDFLDAAAGPGNRFEVRGLDPPDRHFHPLTEFRCAGQTIRNALEAERTGYDAFVIGHFQEPGLLEIRGALDIPVIGLGEAAMLTALSMGGRFGLVTIDPVFIDWHERQVRAQGLDDRVAGVRAIKMDLPGFMRAFTEESSYAKVRADFIEQVRPLVAAGAEVIIPAGGLPMLLFASERPFVIDGALVLNGIAVAVKAAEMALALRDLTGAVVSRRGTYAKASAACIEEYLRARW
jgi:allantoin racemase